VNGCVSRNCRLLMDDEAVMSQLGPEIHTISGPGAEFERFRVLYGRTTSHIPHIDPAVVLHPFETVAAE